MKNFLLGLLLPFFAFAVEPIQSIQQIKDHITDQTLVVFDIDDTLTILRHPAFHMPNYKTHALIFENVMNSLDTEGKLKTFNLPLVYYPSDLIEENAPELIREMQQKGVRVLAITAVMPGMIGEFEIEDYRIAELNRVGIDFSSSFSDMPQKEFCDFRAGALGRHALFKNGIIFSHDLNKGDLLVHFLKTCDWIPGQIIFIDDRAHHLKSAENALKAFNPAIAFIGLQFCGQESFYQKIDAETFQQVWDNMAEQTRLRIGG